MKQAMDNQLKIFERELDDFAGFLEEVYADNYPVVRQHCDDLIVAFHDLKEFWEE
jgi:hypothetical protein